MTAPLLLDEMFSPGIAAELRQLGHDVLAVADRPDLRSKSDEEVFAWATAQKRWLLTENVKDFRPILLRALQAGQPSAGVLFTSSRTFPRSRKNPGPLVRALDGWLTAGPPAPPILEAWLVASTLPTAGHKRWRWSRRTVPTFMT
jgi:predicted nuclease of predicted toxin-antitoxin system